MIYFPNTKMKVFNGSGAQVFVQFGYNIPLIQLQLLHPDCRIHLYFKFPLREVNQLGMFSIILKLPVPEQGDFEFFISAEFINCLFYQFFYAVHIKADERLIGFVYLPWVAWSNRSVFIRLLVAETEDLHRYGRQALDLILGYIFHELNLYRVTVIQPEYNREMGELFEQAGFRLEVSMRDFCYRNGRLWDQLVYGCTLEDWKGQPTEVVK